MFVFEIEYTRYIVVIGHLRKLTYDGFIFIVYVILVKVEQNPRACETIIHLVYKILLSSSSSSSSFGWVV